MEADEAEAEQAKAKDFRALDALFAEAGRYKTLKEVKELFEFTSKFPKYSLFNICLIHAQKPGSHYVATAREWLNRFGRTIKPGARPLVILQPQTPVNFVFDVGDTEGDELSEEITDPFKVIGEPRKIDLNCLAANLKRDRVKYLEVDFGAAQGGSICVIPGLNIREAVMEKEMTLFHLSVKKNHSPGEQFATIAHELGHLCCGHLGSPCPDWWSDRRKALSLNAREFEAESVSWLVGERAGLKISAARYLNWYMDDGAEIPQGISLELVIKSAGLMESMCQRKLADRQMPKPKPGDEAVRQKNPEAKNLFPEAKRYG